jgi:hypothetical protein
MSENKQMTLSECARHDHNTGAKHKLTGWGKISADRAKRGVSRKARIARKKDSGS